MQSLQSKAREYGLSLFDLYGLSDQYAALINQDYLVNQIILNDERIGSYALHYRFQNKVAVAHYLHLEQNKRRLYHDQILINLRGTLRCEYLL